MSQVTVNGGYGAFKINVDGKVAVDATTKVNRSQFLQSQAATIMTGGVVSAEAAVSAALEIEKLLHGK